MEVVSKKQLRKLEAIKKKKTRARVSKYRSSKRENGLKLVQFYLEPKIKNKLDDYKLKHNLTTSEVMSQLILEL